jgi:hypothetical protein
VLAGCSRPPCRCDFPPCPVPTAVPLYNVALGGRRLTHAVGPHYYCGATHFAQYRTVAAEECVDLLSTFIGGKNRFAEVVVESLRRLRKSNTKTNQAYFWQLYQV